MAAPITGIHPAAPPFPELSPARSAGGSAGGFGSLLAESIARVEQFAQNAESTTTKFVSGESEEVHQTVLATQQAELAFELFLQVRNKVVQAYQEVMRMQL
jgi:flagellar hook-basal body complex protein FliE